MPMNDQYYTPKKMKLSKDKLYLLILSGIFFTASLTQTAIASADLEDKTLSGFALLIMGGTVILGGATLEWFIWLANPLYFISIFLLLKDDNRARITSTIATLIALSFSTWENILVSESGRTGKIDSLGYGYWTWVIGLFILTAGIIYLQRNKNR